MLEKGFSKKGKSEEKLLFGTERMMSAKKDGINKIMERSNNLAYDFKLFIHKNPLTIKNGAKEKVVGAVSKKAA